MVEIREFVDDLFNSGCSTLHKLSPGDRCQTGFY